VEAAAEDAIITEEILVVKDAAVLVEDVMEIETVPLEAVVLAQEAIEKKVDLEVKEEENLDLLKERKDHQDVLKVLLPVLQVARLTRQKLEDLEEVNNFFLT
jgi:serine kinase of HPr protein (carbohydrate metabolism regulator)